MAEASKRFGLAMCDVLGIDAKQCTGVTIQAPANDVLRVDVSLAPTLTDAQLLAIADALIADGKQVKVILRRVEYAEQ